MFVDVVIVDVVEQQNDDYTEYVQLLSCMQLMVHGSDVWVFFLFCFLFG